MSRKSSSATTGQVMHERNRQQPVEAEQGVRGELRVQVDQPVSRFTGSSRYITFR